MPTDSAKLDGSGSGDVDSSITSYKWINISGSPTFAIVNASSARTGVKYLKAGVYVAPM